MIVGSLFLNIDSMMSGVRSSDRGKLFHTGCPNWTTKLLVAVVGSGAWNSQSTGVSGSKTPSPEA